MLKQGPTRPLWASGHWREASTLATVATPIGWRRLREIHPIEGHWQGKIPAEQRTREKQAWETPDEDEDEEGGSKECVRHLFESLWYEATVGFICEVLLIGFSHQQSYFTVEWWRQGQGTILHETRDIFNKPADHTERVSSRTSDHLSVTPVQTLKHDTSQAVLHSRQRMLQQPGSHHTDLLVRRLPQTQRKLFA